MMRNKEKEEDEEFFIPAQLREKLKSNNRQELSAHKDVGLLSEKAQEYIRFIKASDIEKKQRKRLIKRFKGADINRNLNKAIRTDDYGFQSHAVGISTKDGAVTKYDRLKQLKNVALRQGRTLVFKGEPNAGKTNFALFLAELGADFEDRTILSNLESVKRGKTFKSYPEMDKMTEKEDKSVIIIEDASNHLSGYNLDRGKVEKYMRPFQNELAKNNAVLFLLGHTGADIHPHLRRNAHLVDKTNKKRAVFYKDVNNGAGSIKIGSFDSISKTSINYDSKEKTVFKWPSEEGKNEKIEKQKILNKIKEKLKSNTVVKTVDISNHKNKDVAQVMRDLADKNEVIQFKEKSPKRIKRPQN